MARGICNSRPLRARGFTLVELLAVTGIAAVLLGLLLATVPRLRRSARSAACLANLRQWGWATLAYANQNDGYLPRRGQGVAVTVQLTRPTDWFNALPPLLNSAPYMTLAANGQIPRPGQASIWLCPSAQETQTTNFFAYGMNMGLSVWEADQNDGKPDTLSSVGDPGTMVLMADAPGDHCSIYPSKTPGGYNPIARHEGRVNIAFLDGHATPVAADQVGCGTGVLPRADMRWLPPRSTWAGAQ